VSEAGLGIAAPAKVNLFLHVTGRRPDGYHEIESLVVFTRAGDRLFAAPAAGLTLEIHGPFAAALDAGRDNLVMRAAEALRRAVGRRLGARLVLEKRLPVAAGIGGGSADAAATLLLLNRLWCLDLAPSRLAAIGLGLGADVPACLAGRAVCVGGIGDRLGPTPGLPAFHLVLVNPGVALATADVFRARRGPFGRQAMGSGLAWPLAASPAADSAAGLAAALASCRNDLDGAARNLEPSVAAVLAALAATPRCLLARMSGSGATGFGLFAGSADAATAARMLRSACRGWWVMATAARRMPPRMRRAGLALVGS